MGRRSGAPSKGDQREQALLDTAESLLERIGLEKMTVDAIAKGAGISRGSLYFYFGSKQEVLAALVDRTMAAIRAEAPNTAVDLASSPLDAMEQAVGRVETAWREHGTVMRAAVDYAPVHPAIGRSWNETVGFFAETMTGLLLKAGVPDGPGPADAPALARALCWMTERSFYQASCAPGDELAQAAATSMEIWRHIMTTSTPPAN
ncbi:TetR/AcrR family transcriptional regulator [Streptomyces sp. NPDC006923]|uniref:TetR/AcrR family transcriptional regulator n=1 Tax=Streptomyces sp. NPDC006923 TaxID=3155355 RepID=UPI0033F53947